MERVLKKSALMTAILDYLANELTLAEFNVCFADIYSRVRTEGDSVFDAACCSRIVVPLAETMRGHRSVQSFRDALRNIVTEEAYGRTER